MGENESNLRITTGGKMGKANFSLGKSTDKIRGDVTREGVVHKGMSKVEKPKECRTSQLTTFPQLTQSPTVKQSEI